VAFFFLLPQSHTSSCFASFFFLFEDVPTNFCWPKFTFFVIQNFDRHYDMQAGIAKTIFIAFHFCVWYILLLEALNTKSN